MKRFGWGLLRVLRAPTLGVPFQDHIPIRGSFVVEVAGKAVDMKSSPTPKQLEQHWVVFAADPVAQAELDKAVLDQFYDMTESEEVAAQRVEAAALKAKEARERWEKAAARAEKKLQRANRIGELLKMTADSVPSLKVEEIPPAILGANTRLLLPDVLTKCGIPRVVQLSRLPNEDTFVADMGHLAQGKHAKKPATAKESQTAAHPFPQNYIQFMQQVARSTNDTGRGGGPQLRVNKLLHERIDETQEDSDYACTGPNEDIPCSFNTLFYLRVGQVGTTEESTEESLREGVARVVSRITEKALSSTEPRFGLGIVCNGRDILFVKVDLEDETIPVYVSEVLRLNSEEGLRHWARFLCCSSAEQFGLPRRNLFEVLRLPSHYSYVRALGSGGFADVLEVHDEATQRKLACKLVRNIFDSISLTREARVLEKLQDVATGVPRLVSCSCALLTSPVGTPLHEHVKSLRGEGERHSFALRVLEELRPVLSAAHARGIVHGDIKPDNLVVGPDGHLFLIDWGSAVFIKANSARHEEEKLSHPTPFLSDELLRGEHPPTAEDDEKALLLTVLAIRESSVAMAPWPYYEWLGDVEQMAQARARWLEEYARTHPELDLSPLLPSCCRMRIAAN